MEFFYLTCIAVKMNLEEMYPDCSEVTAESPIELYKLAQRESIPMNKFCVWMEEKIREKFNLDDLDAQNQSKNPRSGFREKLNMVTKKITFRSRQNSDNDKNDNSANKNNGSNNNTSNNNENSPLISSRQVSPTSAQTSKGNKNNKK